MELSHRTTILLSQAQHQRLKELARHRKTSIGELVRSACDEVYGLTDDRSARLAAIEELEAMGLPVGTPQEMKRESLARLKDILP